MLTSLTYIAALWLHASIYCSYQCEGILMKRLSSFLLIAFCLSSVNLWADEELVPSLSVQGQAQIQVQADQVEFRVGVETQAKTADKALDDNAKKLDKMIKVLASKGLVNEEYQTGRFSINPQWSSRPKNFSSHWVSEIEAYRVSNELIIKTSQFKKVGEWIAAATEQGANRAGQLNFGLKDADSHRHEAIRLATIRAKGYADEAAAAAGVMVKRVVAINVNNAHSQPIYRQKAMRSEMALMSSADSVAAPAINPGDITVSASVNMTFEIK